MATRLETFKPAAGTRLHLLLAAALWTAVGALLAGFGSYWACGDGLPWVPLLLAGAVAAGIAKGLLVLEPAAARMIARIHQRGDGRCLGGFISWKTWLFIAAMAAAGRLARGTFGLHSTPRAVLGLVYAAVGVGLLVAGRRLWMAWYRHEPRSSAPL